MPIYEYKCEHCAHQLEILQKISDEPLKTCPECGQDALRKMISAAAFKLKGTGWYETDFKDKKPKGDTKTTDSTDKTDTKPKPDSTDTGKKETTTKKTETTKSSTKTASSE